MELNKRFSIHSSIGFQNGAQKMSPSKILVFSSHGPGFNGLMEFKRVENKPCAKRISEFGPCMQKL